MFTAVPLTRHCHPECSAAESKDLESRIIWCLRSFGNCSSTIAPALFYYHAIHGSMHYPNNLRWPPWMEEMQKDCWEQSLPCRDPLRSGQDDRITMALFSCLTRTEVDAALYRWASGWNLKQLTGQQWLMFYISRSRMSFKNKKPLSVVVTRFLSIINKSGWTFFTAVSNVL